MAWLAKIGVTIFVFFSGILGFSATTPAPTIDFNSTPVPQKVVNATTTPLAPAPRSTPPIQTGTPIEEDRNAWSQHAIQQNCVEGITAFTQPITTLSAISRITPGNVTGDARYTYLWIQGQETVSLFAPADGTLIKIAYKVRTDLPPNMSAPDYDLAFQADCHTIYGINHITNPIAEIVASASVTKPIEIKPGSGVSDADTKPMQNITVKAGQLIGTTTGTPAAHNFDFGIFVDGNAVCPYEKFEEPIRSQWLALFGQALCTASGGM